MPNTMVALTPHRGLKRSEARGVPERGMPQIVVEWFGMHGRDFPWRRTNDAFHILMAEVLLRQTQAGRIAAPYEELVKKYPEPAALANGDSAELQQWFQPLGLVKRADRLISCAQVLESDYAGRVPRSLEALMSLPGLGRYSARAVLCTAFDEQVPMIDEGSGRVLRRVMGIASKGPAHADSQLMKAAEALLPDRHARPFNMGLLDIAAAYCRPNKPRCGWCPLVDTCQYAHREGKAPT